MADDPPVYLYVPLTGKLPNGSEVLVQLFINPGPVLDIKAATVAFRADPWTTWGIPHDLEVRS